MVKWLRTFVRTKIRGEQKSIELQRKLAAAGKPKAAADKNKRAQLQLNAQQKYAK